MYKVILLLTGTIILNLSSAIAKDYLAGTSGTLANIDSAINAAVRRAENLYEEKNGKRMRKNFNLLSKNAKNPYLNKLAITKTYKIQIELAKKAKRVGRGEIPVAKSLLGKKILLIPIYRKGDAKITSWQCLTDADTDVQRFIGDNGTKEYKTSFISNHTKNTYLSVCKYIKKTKLFR